MDPITGIELAPDDRGRWRLDWSAVWPEEPIAVHRGNTPEAVDFSQPLAPGVRGGITLPGGWPACFGLQRENGQRLLIAPRQVPLEGATNLRDLGGYATRDGRRVRWGTLFRSGHLSRLTARGREGFAKLDIRTVCDFRQAEERINEHADLPGAPHLETIGVPAGTQDRYFFHRLFEATGDPAVVAAEIGRLLRIYVQEFHPHFRRMFQTLLNHPGGGILLNCSAGKERTGVGAVLVLLALGVPRATQRHDFLLSRRYFPIAEEVGRVLRKYAVPSHDDASLTPLVMPLLETQDGYADAVFSALDAAIADCGSEEALLLERYGIGEQERAALRARYTQTI